MKRALLTLAILLCALPAVAETYSFGVLSQRSPILTAEYWNPILAYVAQKTGVALELKIARTAPESSEAIGRGEYDFAYSNHLFKPANLAQEYRVILRPGDAPITGQIVTLARSPIRKLADLRGREVGFPSKAAFVGYAVPMDYLTRKGIEVSPVFGGNQEGIMAQLKAGRVIAAAVNDQVMRSYATREHVRYRVLWQSAHYNNLPVAVHPRVPAAAAEAVRDALAGMLNDPEGARILRDCANQLGQENVTGFVRADDRDYANYREFFRQTVLPDL